MKTIHKKNGGFTLVELIVVIAILAILAAVAIPAYSGYIAKAEKAGDMQLLGAVNTAYNSALVDNGIYYGDVLAAVITLNSDGTVNGLQSVRVRNASTLADETFTPTAIPNTLYAGESVKALADAFTLYFSGNETAKFKVLTRLAFNPNTGLFCDPDSLSGEEEVTLYFGETPITVNGEDAAKLANSTFADSVGSELLLGKVDSVSSIASGLLLGNGYSVIDKIVYGLDHNNPNSSAYMKELAENMGISQLQLTKMVGLGNMTEEEKATFFANSLVLTAAQNTSKLENTDFLGQAGFAAQLQKDLDDPNKTTDALTQAALAYGMYTAYANSSYGTDDMKQKVNDLETSGGFGGLTTMLSDLESEEFTKYLNSAEGKADLEAYKSAMKLIDDSTSQSSQTAVDIMKNGFNDPELESLLAQIMGK